MDKLDEIFELQKGLNNRIGVNAGNMSEEERVEWVQKLCTALSQEQSELIDSLKWSWWKTYQTQNDWQNARVEIVDMLHFLLSLALISGIDAKKLHSLYLQKNKVNHARQDSGYTEKIEDNKGIV